MITLTQQQVQRNMRAVAHAIAQQEGLTVPEVTIADLRRVALGEIDTDEVVPQHLPPVQECPDIPAMTITLTRHPAS